MSMENAKHNIHKHSLIFLKNGKSCSRALGDTKAEFNLPQPIFFKFKNTYCY